MLGFSEAEVRRGLREVLLEDGKTLFPDDQDALFRLMRLLYNGYRLPGLKGSSLFNPRQSISFFYELETNQGFRERMLAAA